MKNKLTLKQLGFLRVFHRSVRDSDGWANVSKIIFPELIKLPEGLVELDEANMKARLTAEAETLLKWDVITA